MTPLMPTLIALAPLLLTSPGATAPAADEPVMEAYTQRVTITLASEEAARRAQVRPAPLLGDKEWAVTCRWDDLIKDDLKMRDVMEAHGYRGNFYLNAPRKGFGAEMGRALLKGGNRIGGHSMTHPYLPYLNRNRLFWEVAAVRAQWEALTDSPICSFAFPFVAFRNRIEGDLVHHDIAAALLRAGYYHAPIGHLNNWFNTGLLVTPLLPSDGAPIDEKAKQYLADPEHARVHPVMSFSMHVWYDTDEKWAKFEEQLDAYGRRPEWWYCNQNEYAAYRYQFEHTRVKAQVDGRRLMLELQRPVLRELNDAVPLTFLIEGVAPEAVAEVGCETAQVDVLAPAQGGALFNLHHDRSQALPVAIGLIENPDNHAEPLETDVADEFPDLRALLAWKDERLQVVLDNGGEPLEDVVITYRLPLAWTPGVERRHVGTVSGPHRDVLTPVLARPDDKYTSGAPYFAAQVDFVRGGTPGRLHLSCRLPRAERDPSYPQGGFLVLGPVAEDAFDAEALAEAVRAGALLSAPPAFIAESSLQWHPESAGAADLLDVEMIETSGTWRNNDRAKKYYLARSTLFSDAAQRASVLRDERNVVAVFVNGRQVEETARLERGRNELVVVAALSGAWFAMENAGSFLRLAEPGSQRRLTNIRAL